jgi:hypothetical protein
LATRLWRQVHEVAAVDDVTPIAALAAAGVRSNDNVKDKSG